MANDQVDFDLWLRSKFDGDALKAAQSEFRRTQKSAEDAGEGMKSAGTGAAAGLKAALGELIAIAAILRQLKEGFAEVSAQEQAFNRLSDAAARFGGNAGVLNEKFEKLAKTIQEKSGLDDDALYLSMVKVYQATGDMNEAMGQAALAADVARGGQKTLEEALSLVNNVAAGQTRELLKMQVGFVSTGDRAVDAANGLEVLRQKFGGSAAAAKGATVELDKMKEEWGNVRNDFISGSGEMLTGVLKFVNLALQPLFISLQLAGNSIKTIIASVREFGGVIGSIISGDWQGAREGLAKTKDTLVTGFETAFEIIKARAEKMWATINGTADGAIDAPKAKGTGKGGGGTGGSKTDDKRELTQAELDLMALSKLQQEMIEKARKEEEKFEAYKKKLRDDAAKNDKARIKDLDAARDEELDRAIKRTVAEVRAKKAAAAAETALANQTADAAMALGDQVFEGNKEWSIASALISTFRAVAGQLAMEPVGPWNIALAAVMLASGLAQVAKIESTDPGTKGSGFDDPGNDRAAYIGGRRWAADMIGEFTSGVSAGWASGMGGGRAGNVTYDNRSTMNLHMNVAGFLDPSDTNAMAKFARNLAVVNKTVEGQRRTARTAR